MHRPILALALGALLLTALACQADTPANAAATPVATVPLENDDQKTLYTLGMAMSQNLYMMDFTAEELVIIQAGLQDGALGVEPRVPRREFVAKVQAMMRVRGQEIAAREKEAGVAYCDNAAQEPGAEKTPSGMVYHEITAGTGVQANPSDLVKLHYTGTLRDGSVFDTSRKGDDAQPAQFRLNAVVACFREGVTKMKVGGRATLVCPAELAYGDRGSPPKIRPGATIIFDVELVEVVNQNATIPSP